MPTTVAAPRSPTIFISPEGGDAHWRLMEKLTALFEHAVNPRPDVCVFSTARVRDCISSSEQVDVALSYLPDPRALFSFAEVRARKAKVGRGFIQEIIGKRKTLGLRDCCVVTTKGFSRDALRLAEHEGIRARRIVIPDKHSGFIGLSEFGVQTTAPEVEVCQVSVYDSVRQRTGIFEASGRDYLTRALLAVTPEGGRVLVPLSLLLDEALSHGGWRQLEEASGGAVSLGLKPAEPGLKLRYVKTDTGLTEEVDVLAVSFRVKARVVETKLPRGETYHYQDAVSGKSLAEAVLFMASRERTALCWVHTLVGEHRSGVVMFLSEQGLSELVDWDNRQQPGC